MERQRSEHLRKTITGISLVAAPVVLLVGGLVHPEDESDAAGQLQVIAGGLDRWYAAHLILLVGFALMIPAVLGLAHLIHERRPSLAWSGGGLSLVGIVAVAAVIGADGMAGYYIARASADSPVSVAALDGVLEDGRMMPIFLATLLLGIGLVVTAVGLYRGKVVAPWSAVAVGLGAALVDLGYPAGVHAMVVAGMAVLLVGMVPIGYSVLTETDTAWEHTPEFAGFRRRAAPLGT